MSSLSWEDCMLCDGIENFNERSQEREELFQKIANDPRFATGDLSPLVWAFLQVADIQKVKDITASTAAWKAVLLIEHNAKTTINLWKQKVEFERNSESNKTISEKLSNTGYASPTKAPILATSGSSRMTRSGKSLDGSDYSVEYSVRRSDDVARLCKKREANLCAVAGIDGVEAYHIYPWCGFGEKNPSQVRIFWETLELFWPERQVACWREIIFQDNRCQEPRGTETLKNMISLCRSMHGYYTDGAFALRPVKITTDKKNLELEFHWQPRKERHERTRMDLIACPTSTRYLEASNKSKFFRFDSLGGHIVLISGTRIIMTTEDPIELPLPDPGLLEMQWHLSRILAMSAAAEGADDHSDHDDPDAFINITEYIEHWLDDQPREYDQWEDSCPYEEDEDIIDNRPLKRRKLNESIHKSHSL